MYTITNIAQQVEIVLGNDDYLHELMTCISTELHKNNQILNEMTSNIGYFSANELLCADEIRDLNLQTPLERRNRFTMREWLNEFFKTIGCEVSNFLAVTTFIAVYDGILYSCHPSRRAEAVKLIKQIDLMDDWSDDLMKKTNRPFFLKLLDQEKNDTVTKLLNDPHLLIEKIAHYQAVSTKAFGNIPSYLYSRLQDQRSWTSKTRPLVVDELVMTFFLVYIGYDLKQLKVSDDAKALLILMVLDTKFYKSFCLTMFGTFLDMKAEYFI